MRQLLRFVIFASFVFAQEPTIRVTTRLIQLNVVVREKNRPVENLTKDDFELFDKNKPQKIAVFSVASTKGVAPMNRTLASNVFSNRIEQRPDSPTAATVLLIDSLNTKFEDQARARHEILQLLHSLTAADRVAVYALGRNLRVLQDFTDDPQRLIRIVAKSRGEVTHELAASEPDPSDTGNPDIDEWMDATQAMIADFNINNRMLMTLSGMEQIANHLSRVPGRKNLIWVSGSFPFGLGIEDMQTAMNTPGRDIRTFHDEIERTTRALNSANIAIYPVDARGLVTRMPPMSASASKNGRPVPPPKPVSGIDTMQLLADRTGGRAFFNTNDLSGAIRAALSDAEATYTLGFYPDSETLDGKFHELKVKVARRGMDVRHRKGYFASAEQAPTEKQLHATLGDALSGPLDATAVGIEAKLDSAGKTGSYVLTIQVDAKNMALVHEQDRWMGKMMLAVVQQAADGKVLNSLARTLDLNLKDDTYQDAAQHGLKMTLSVTTAEGMSQFRVAVGDPLTGAVGSVRIPAPKQN